MVTQDEKSENKALTELKQNVNSVCKNCKNKLNNCELTDKVVISGSKGHYIKQCCNRSENE